MSEISLSSKNQILLGFPENSGFTIVCIGKQLSFRINYSPYGYNFKGKYSNIEGRKIG